MNEKMKEAGWVDVRCIEPEVDSLCWIYVSGFKNIYMSQYIGDDVNRFENLIAFDLLNQRLTTEVYHSFDLEMITHWMPLPELPKE